MATAAALLRSGGLSSAALAEAVLARADALDPGLGVFAHRTASLARAEAARADAELARGVDRGPLHGIPLGVKDAFATVAAPTTMNSRVYGAAPAGRDAGAVRRLREAGAVMAGMTTTMELCCVYPDHAAGEPVSRNPWDTGRWTGGSSSGSAGGLAAGLFLAALGTDTGGSVRLPASYCGVTGVKPTFGRVGTDGLFPLAPGLDHAGPMARTAADCALLLTALADGWTPRPRPMAGLRIGVESRHHLDIAGAHPDVVRAVRDAAEVLAGLGADVVEAELPGFAGLVDAAEKTSWAMARETHREGLERRPHTYSRNARAQFSAAAKAGDPAGHRVLIEKGREDVARLFGTIDALLLPTTVRPADRVEELRSGAGLHRTRYTRAWNALGNPAMSVPAGFSRDGLPLGLQIVGALWDEATVLAVGETFQSATGWHLRTPPDGGGP
ncbi:amidase [Actinomadura darangshiensis]|uniref:Amidase n=1 Tax=Actinomadura darangshiensis TaxID=705336 RepID=A0A4R5AJX4_9ACTN|nr:amidase [Actinomadura darangshiensis]